MFSWKKEAAVENKPQANRRNVGQRAKGQLPLFDIPGMDEMENMNDNLGDDDDDDDLEEELKNLQMGLDIRKVVSRKRLGEESLNPKKLILESGSDDESDVSVDENDPTLLAELASIEHPTSKIDVSIKVNSSMDVKKINTAVMKPDPPKLPPSLPARPTRVAPSAPAPTTAANVNRSSPASSGISLPTSTSTSTPSSGNSTLDMLQERLSMYKTAHQNAVSASETAKIRRLDRGIKTLETMLKASKAGRPVNEEDIPLPVAISARPILPPTTTPSSSEENQVDPTPTQDFVRPSLPDIDSQSSAPPPLPPRVRHTPDILQPHFTPSAPLPSPPQTPRTSAADQKTIDMLTERRNQYRQAALTAKRENNLDKTRDYVKIAKQFDLIIEAIGQGQEVDLKGMPPPPPNIEKPPPSSSLMSPQTENPSIMVARPLNQKQLSIDRNMPIELPVEELPDDPSVFNPPPTPSSPLEALQQRLQKYKSAVEEANEMENSSKARRMGRIVKQYEDAIKSYKAGKPVNFDDLPTPPGFAPIPIASSAPGPKVPPSAAAIQNTSNTVPTQQVKSPPNAPSSETSTPAPKLSAPVQTKSQKSPLSLHEKQLAAILERQKSFKEAALDAKKRGDVQAAKEYLRVAKGFEPMIQAAKCGLPVNMDSLPISPQSNAESAFELISKEDCEPAGDRQEMYEKLEKELLAQIEMCTGNRLHFSKIGDVQNTHKFETLLLNTKKDLNFVRHSLKRGDPIPRFHYETKTFSIVRCCTDLGDDDCELNVIKGINYSCPNPAEVDTYIKFEFPFPLETPQKDKTVTIKNTNCPDYNAVFKLSINRKSRNCTSVFKRKAIKLEVWSKGGFLRSDTLLGTANVKLQPLETRCILHDSFDLMEGRKPVGGKLEVKLRIREPLLTKQVDTMCEKWLIISANHVTRV